MKGTYVDYLNTRLNLLIKRIFRNGGQWDNDTECWEDCTRFGSYIELT